MTYLSAKIELLQKRPKVPFGGMLIEAAAMTAVAGILVILFV